MPAILYVSMEDILTQIHQAIPSFALWIIFFIVALISGIMTLIFFYHWNQYGTNSITNLKLKIYYLLGTLSFLGLALFSLFLY